MKFLNESNSRYYPLLHNTRLLGLSFLQLTIQQTWREGNQCADLTTNLGLIAIEKVSWQGNYPAKLIELAQGDVSKLDMRGCSLCLH